MYRVELKDGVAEYLGGKVENVPNVPCGVERLISVRGPLRNANMFLMYRVELKGENAFPRNRDISLPVPNVPCGVESSLTSLQLSFSYWLFLMYRVELKAFPSLFYHPLGPRPVPNVPCGVESRKVFMLVFKPWNKRFLMYRVELKGGRKGRLRQKKESPWFLMYRVELKVGKVPPAVQRTSTLFLMYRVELKGWKSEFEGR